MRDPESTTHGSAEDSHIPTPQTSTGSKGKYQYITLKWSKHAIQSCQIPSQSSISVSIPSCPALQNSKKRSNCMGIRIKAAFPPSSSFPNHIVQIVRRNSALAIHLAIINQIPPKPKPKIVRNRLYSSECADLIENANAGFSKVQMT
jgi:hypothetical protein